MKEVRCHTSISNVILDSLLPQLPPFQQLVYLRLYRLSHGFRSDKCLVSLQRLAASCGISPSSAIRAIRELEQKKLICRIEPKLGGKMSEPRGNRYWVYEPSSSPEAIDPLADPTKRSIFPRMVSQSHHRENKDENKSLTTRIPIQSHHWHLAETILAYSTITGNAWVKNDETVYEENKISDIPIDKVKATLQAVAERNGGRINSFNYFLKEILAQREARTQFRIRKSLTRIVRRIRENRIGCANDSLANFTYDVKAACVREGVIFDHDEYNRLISQ